MSNQLSLFGITPSQDTFQSVLWGELTFYPTKTNKWRDTCRHCLLWVHKHQQTDQDECLLAPCSKEDRTDEQNGYFGIHSMPTQSK